MLNVVVFLSATTTAVKMNLRKTCICSGISSNLKKRPDYGTVCASWDARDEKPWCAVKSSTACGADDTFESQPGMWWSHKPCKSTPILPPPLPASAASGAAASTFAAATAATAANTANAANAAADVAAAAAATSVSFQLHENVDAAHLPAGRGTLLKVVDNVDACKALCESTPSCSGFAFYEGVNFKAGTKWHHACAAIGSGAWSALAVAGVTSGKRCAPGKARNAAPLPFGAWDTKPVEASWPRHRVKESEADAATKHAMAVLPTTLPVDGVPLGATERESWGEEGLAFLEKLHTQTCTASTPMLSYIVPDVGFGNQIVQVLLHYAQAVAQQRSFVVIWPQKASWFAPKYQLGDLLRLSSCQPLVQNAEDDSENQKVWKKEALKFTALRQTAYLRCMYEPGSEWDNSDLEMPAIFKGRPLTWWYRTLTQFLVQPSKRVQETSHALVQALPKQLWLGGPRAGSVGGLSKATFVNSYAATVAAIKFGPRPLVGMHIRGGDACADNRRPTVCITFANAMRQLLRNGIHKGSIIISTDDESVARDAQAYTGPFQVMVLDIDRKKLASSTFVESRTDLNRVTVFEEMWTEIGLLVQADVLMGSFYSNFARVALQLSDARAYIPLDAFWCPYCLCQLNMPQSSGQQYSSSQWGALMEQGLKTEITRKHIFDNTSSVPLFQHAAEQLARVTSKTGCYA